MFFAPYQNLSFPSPHLDLNIISLNVNGLNNIVKRKMERDKGDFVFLQETHLRRQEHEKLKKTTNSQANCTTDKEGRYVLVVGKIESVDFSFLNVYYPPDTGPELMSKVIDLLMTKSKGVGILGGDLKMIMNTKLDSSNEKKSQSRENCKCPEES
uniref:Endonuclease/exonuclease/phosphatase domain-containing protein n=1 Tax=Labrus bergylta TaxID=56723 RepID=A0A3Q3G2C2_9LABR